MSPFGPGTSTRAPGAIFVGISPEATRAMPPEPMCDMPMPRIAPRGSSFAAAGLGHAFTAPGSGVRMMSTPGCVISSLGLRRLRRPARLARRGSAAGCPFASGRRRSAARRPQVGRALISPDGDAAGWLSARAWFGGGVLRSGRGAAFAGIDERDRPRGWRWAVRHRFCGSASTGASRRRRRSSRWPMRDQLDAEHRARGRVVRDELLDDARQHAADR